MFHNLRRGLLSITLLFVFTRPYAMASAAPARGVNDFSGWHLPLPAGKWQISRGPCGSAARFTHNCGYYEERCAIDFVPLSGSMKDAPVLAPQVGQVFFLGVRPDSGLTLMLLHADGRVSGFMHLSKIVVGPDEAVSQGQVVGYAGSTGYSGNPHLHFFVQRNVVQRECVDLTGLDVLDFRLEVAVSRNRAWTDLTLPDPPAALPEWLPTLAAAPAGSRLVLPARILLAPGARTILPVAVVPTSTTTLDFGGLIATPVLRTSAYTVFNVPLAATTQNGDYELNLRATIGAGPGPAGTARYSVRQPPAHATGPGVIVINPFYLSPNGWESVGSTPQLCWGEDAKAAQKPFQFRILVAGLVLADSGWIAQTCWTPPRLKAGTYYWKIFVRDARGYMNRTNQRPYAFIVSGQ
jgi:hypothetical protein